MTPEFMPPWFDAFMRSMDGSPPGSMSDMIVRAHRWGHRAGIQDAAEECEDMAEEASGKGLETRAKAMNDCAAQIRRLAEARG